MVEQRRADAFLAGLQADAADCARSVVPGHLRQGDVSPAELYQDPQRLALARTVALAERAVACLRAVRDDVEDCSSSSAICSVAPRDRFPGRGGVSVTGVPALRAEQSRQEQLARSGRGLPPVPLHFAGAREDGPAARFS